MPAVATKPAIKTRRKPANHEPAIKLTANLDVFTLAEAAEYLRVSTNDVVQMVNEQALPGRRVGPDWRFLKSAVQEWLRTPERRSGKDSLMSLRGTLKDDPTMGLMISDVYRRRGRPMVEETAIGRRQRVAGDVESQLPR